ncbi:MAG: T9SS type A sorting domain-containing protein [Bacteroidales bacterium]|nr:T9SS type A sorting domain-containing protein [Bacteroidales bacterium]
MRKSFTTMLLLCLAFSLRAQEEQVCQPDSARIYFDLSEHPYWHYDTMYTFSCTYDSDGLLRRLRTEWWAENDKYFYRRHQYEYDSKHNLTHDRFSGASWDYPPGLQALKIYSYQNNLLSSDANYDYDYHSGPPFWHCVDSSAYLYDELGRLSKKDIYYSNMQHTTTISYDYSIPFQTVVTTERNNNGAWNTISRTTNVFSEEKLLLSSLTELCDEGVFSNKTIVTYNYNGSGKLSDILTQNWADGEWTNVKLLSYGYNENNHLVSLEIKEWHDNEFENKDRAVYEPNESGYPTVVTFETWNGVEWESGTWKSDLFVYNEDFLYRQNTELCEMDVRRIEIHYINTPMPNYSVEEQNTPQEFCSLHPNPTTGLVTITGKDLRTAKVINALGQCVATIKGDGEQLTLDISNLPAGIYFVNITDSEGRKCVRKVVKE